MKSLLSVLPVTVLVVPLCALAGIVVRGVRTGPAREGPALPSAPGCQEVEGAPCAGTVSWWTKKPFSPDAEGME